MRKLTVEGKMYDLLTEEEYLNQKDYYDNANVAVEVNYEGKHIGLPVTKNKNSVGIYNNGGPLMYYNMPKNISDYECNANNKYIDFNNISDINEYYEKSIQYSDAEKEIVSNNINQSKPKIKDTDSPLLKLTKQTITDKNIDLDKYSHKFDNYNNDKRLLSSSNNDITIKKANNMLEKLDVDMYVITTNKNPDVPNPMPNPLVRRVSGDGDEISVEELISILRGE